MFKNSLKANATFQSLFLSGFALKVPSKRTRFTEDQLLYIEEKFEQGRPSTANKAKPNVVAKQMREETVEDENGIARARFPPELWLKEEQIRSLFSKMALNIRAGDIQHVQENPTEDVFVAEAQQAVDEEQGNLFDANVESHTILEVKKRATQKAEDEVAGHPLMVRDRIRLYIKFEPISSKIYITIFFQLNNDVSICTLADCIQNDKNYDLSEALEPSQIMEVLQRIGCKTYKEADFYTDDEDKLEDMSSSIKRMIKAYVMWNCTCII